MQEPVPVKFGAEADKALETHVYDEIKALKDAHKDLFEIELPEMRRKYYGIPKNKDKSWPWKNASNLVVQAIGETVDELLARVLSAQYQISPLWVQELVGEWADNERGEEQRTIMEAFMNLMGLESDELDLYRVEYGLYHDAIKFGFQCVKSPYIVEEEAIVTGSAGDGGMVDPEEVIYEGPRPEKIPYENFLVTPDAKTLRSARMKVHIIPLTKMDLQERAYKKIYDKAAVEKIIKSGPDKFGPTRVEKEAQEATGAVTSNAPANAIWELYECWFPYWHNDKKYRIIFTYHFKSKTKLRALFNWYPKNNDPFIGARLGYEGDTIRGRGFCKMLSDYQDQLSTTNNQDVDAGTLANTSIFRVDPSSRLDANFSIFPSAMIPAREGEFEVMQMGRDNTQSNVERQRLTTEMMKNRAGVSPPIGGTGGGITNPKKGGFSAMGTFAVMQQGDRRTNINITDFRYTHVLLGRAFQEMYAAFGVQKKAKLFGEKSELLIKAFENVAKGRMKVPIRAATASVNRELEKQNDLMLIQIVRQHYMWVGQIIQNVSQAPPQLQDYVVKTVVAGDLLMRHIMRNFGHDDVTRFVPEANIIKELRENAGRSGSTGAAGATSSAAPTQVPGASISGPQRETAQSLQQQGGQSAVAVPTGKP